MTTETSPSAMQSFPLPDAFSNALNALLEQAQASVVQVRREGHGAGTGVVWQSNGGIITNAHVVPADGIKVQVELPDGRVLDARLVDREPTLDLALLSIPVDNLPAIPVGDSAKLRVGELVCAIGHPWGHRGVVTAGIVSALSKVKVRNSEREIDYIKSDVRLAPGNSGGPLLDAQGRVVGINAMIFGGDLSVAIPSNVVSAWVAGLPKTPVSLGVQVQPSELSAAVRQQITAENVGAGLAPALQATGLLVVGIIADGRAERSGLLVGDILLELAGQPLQTVATLRSVLGQNDEQVTLPLRLLRGGNIQVVDVMVKLAESAA